MLQSTNGRNIVRNIPVDRILIESDAPFTKGLNEKYTIDFNNDIYNYMTLFVRYILIFHFYYCINQNAYVHPY